MNPFALALLVITAGGVLFASRKAAMACFLIGCCYMTVGQGVVIAGFNFPMIRMLVVMGLVRVIMRGEKLAGGFNKIDKWVFIWAAWVMFASLFHEWAPGSGPKFTSGALLNVLGFYVMVRTFCTDKDSVMELFGMLCWILAPVAFLMFLEQALHRNFFAVFGGVPDVPAFRNGRYRAQGPFNHAILAGTVAAACVPLIMSTWRHNRIRAIVGLTSCVVMVLTCSSSGPIMSCVFAAFAVGLWWRPQWVPLMLKAAIPVYIALMVVMERPPYYLISKIDLTGSSTGWHRARLIEGTLNHFSEWWLFGTDYTRHWMPRQGAISENHTDVTNQFIAYAVNGGLLSVVLVIAVIVGVFMIVARAWQSEHVEVSEKWFLWCVGSSLFALCASGISVAFFGQALFFFWLPIACLASFASVEHQRVAESVPEESQGYPRGTNREGSHEQYTY